MCNVIIQLINYFQIIVFTFLSEFYVSASIPETPFFCKTCIYYCLYLTSGRSSHTGSMCNSLQIRHSWFYGFTNAYQLS